MANLSKGYRKWMAVGCSHGHLADKDALAKVLEFKRKYKPHRTFHLGDMTDQAAFRGGAHGTSDECVSIEGDLTHGLSFLKALSPTDMLIGNHEVRLYRAADHHNEILAQAARSVIKEMQSLAKKLKANFVETYDINSSWITLGNTKFLHGFMFNEMAIRDHAEQFGQCVLAHLHIVGEMPARRSDHAHGYCVGTLANIPSMAYAQTRRATSRWSHGFAWGEYSDTDCRVNLSECAPGNALNWRLPL